jgi:tetratricopeptide (TPR) repeat protein
VKTQRFSLQLAPLTFEPLGDYSDQIEQLLEKGPVENRPGLVELVASLPGLILLGKTGSGKTTQLKDLYLFQASQTLAQLERATSPEREEETPLYLPIYLDLSEVALTGELAAKDTPVEEASTDLFQQSLNHALEQVEVAPLPEGLFEQVVPLVLMDNLNLLEPSYAPVFLYKFNQWLGQNSGQTRVVIACRHLDFLLYYPWFKAEQPWQFFSLQNFSWNEVKETLTDRLTPLALQGLEQVGLTELFTSPALNSFFLQKLGEPPENLLQLVKQLLEQPAGFGSSLVRYSRLLTREQAEALPLPAEESTLLRLGLLEKHPVAGLKRLVSPAFDRLIVSWFLLQAVPAQQIELMNRLRETTQNLGTGWEIHLAQLFYYLTDPEKQRAIFGVWLGQPPHPTRLEQLLEVGSADPAFNERWQAYLRSLLAENITLAYGLQLARLCAFTGDSTSASRVQLAEIALELLVKMGQADARLHLEIGRVQERFGKPAAALVHYEQASQSSDLTLLESTLNVARLLTERGQYDRAFNRLDQLNNQVTIFQSQIYHQLSVVHRTQKQTEVALNYARQAVQLHDTPTFRHNLALVLYQKGDRAQAEQVLTQLTTDYRDFAPGFHELGRLQLERGANEAALANLRQAVELNSNTAEYLYDLGYSLATQSRFEEAFVYLQAALTVSEDRVEVQPLLAFGKVALKLNHLAQSRMAFQKAITVAGEKSAVEALVYLAAVDFTEGEYSEAAASLLKAQEVAPNDVRLPLLSALVAETDEQTEIARNSYAAALQLMQGQPETELSLQVTAHLGMARAERLARNLTEANQHCQQARKLQPDSALLYYELGQLALARHGHREAVNFLIKGLKIWHGVFKDEETTGLFETSWVTLFRARAELEFDLTFAYALALSQSGQHPQAQKVWMTQLKNLAKHSPGGAKLAQKQAAIYYQLGLSLLATEVLEQSQSYLTRAIESEPNNARFHLGLAKVLLATNRRDKALSELKEAQRLDPSLAEVYVELAELQLNEQGPNFDQTLLLNSLNLYSRALALEPNRADHCYRAALLAYHLGYHNQASRLIQRVIELESIRQETYLLLVCNHEQTGQLELALTELEKNQHWPAALKAPSYLVEARLAHKAGLLTHLEQALAKLRPLPNLPLRMQAIVQAEAGWLAETREQFEEAARCYEQAVTAYREVIDRQIPLKLEEFYLCDEPLSNQPQYDQTRLADYYLVQAGVLNRLKQYTSALAALEEALRLNPQPAKTHALRGEILLKLGYPAEALLALKLAAEGEALPSHYFALGQAYLQLDDAPAALSALKQVAASSEITGTSEYYRLLGQAYEKAGNLTEACNAYSRGLQIDPGNAALYRALAGCYLHQGEKLAAVQPLQGAVVCAPDNLEYHLELARLYEELNWWQETISEYEQITRLQPDNAYSWFKLGQVWLKLDQAESGKAALERALGLDDTLAEAHYELGRFYLKNYQLDYGQAPEVRLMNYLVNPMTANAG